MRTAFVLSAVLVVAVSARGEIFSSEFTAHPTEEGWGLVPPACGVSATIENGHYVQRLDPQACSASPDAAREIYARPTGGSFGTAGQFLEFRVQTDGALSGSCIEMPTQIRLSLFGSDYWRIVVANNQAVFTDFSITPPLPFFLAPGAAHTIRLEWETPLDATQPDYRFFVDDIDVWTGTVWSFLSDFTLLEWSGTTCLSTTENRWDYIRYGDIPTDGSGDFDSDGHIDGRDYYFFEDCFSRRDPGQNDGPGCRFADMDGNGGVDLRDFADFQLRFLAPG